MVLALILMFLVAGCNGTSSPPPCSQPYSLMPVTARIDAERDLDGPTSGTKGMNWHWYESFSVATGSCVEVSEVWEWIDCEIGWKFIVKVRVPHATCPKPMEDWP